MALVLVAKTRQRPAIGQANPTLGSFQGLNGWFFINGQDERILGRIEIKTDNVSGLAHKLRIGGNAPAAAPFQFNALLAQNAPDLIGGNIGQTLRQQSPIPAPVARRWIFIQQRQDPLDRHLIILGRLSTAWRVFQASQALAHKAPPPFTHRHLGNAQALGNRTSTQARCRLQDNLTPDLEPVFDPLRSTPTLQELAVFHRKFDATRCHPSNKS